MNKFLEIFITLLVITSSGFGDAAQDQRKEIATRALDWLYFDDWGRPKPVAEPGTKPRLPREPTILRRDLHNPDIFLLVQPINVVFSGSPAETYLFDVKSKQLISLHDNFQIPKTYRPIVMTIIPKGDSIWDVSIAIGQGIPKITVKLNKGSGSYIVDQYLEYMILD